MTVEQDIERIVDTAKESIQELADEIRSNVIDEVIDNHPIFKAADMVLERAIGKDGECRFCEQTLGFHANDCVVHEIALALDWEME